MACSRPEPIDPIFNTIKSSSDLDPLNIQRSFLTAIRAIPKKDIAITQDFLTPVIDIECIGFCHFANSPGAEGGPVCNHMSPNFDS